jgi:hypothetical protein
MKSGRAIGYEPSAIVASVGSTQVAPGSSATANVRTSLTSRANAKPTQPSDERLPSTPCSTTLSSLVAW